MVKEKRKSKRRTVRYSVWRKLADDRVCRGQLSDISETGARIELENTAAVPDKFILALSANGVARRVCRVVWRKPQELGVKFDRNASVALPVLRSRHERVPGAARADSEGTTRVRLPT
jgi:PilZ domain